MPRPITRTGRRANEMREYQRRWYREHKEQCLLYQRKYNLEHRRAWSPQYQFKKGERPLKDYWQPMQLQQLSGQKLIRAVNFIIAQNWK